MFLGLELVTRGIERQECCFQLCSFRINTPSPRFTFLSFQLHSNSPSPISSTSHFLYHRKPLLPTISNLQSVRMPTTYFEETPASPEAWTTAATKANVTNKSLKDCENLRSGSEVTHEQFLLFRAYCPGRGPCTFDGETHGLADKIQRAKLALAESKPFQEYLAAIHSGKALDFVMEMFKVPYVQQREVLQSAQKVRSRLTDIDETSVNSSLISFLQAVTSTVPEHTSQWRSTRIRLTASFTATEKTRQYVALTDGQLQDLNNDEIQATVECKRRDRPHHSPQVDMQEVSQVVAWVKEYPEPDVR